MFVVGQTVWRVEAVKRAAMVLEVDTSDLLEVCYRIEYAEGGEGWWPESALTGSGP